MGTSLRLKLGFGAALLGLCSCTTALILWIGLNTVSDRLDAALAAEARMAGYATLSQQAATFLVVAIEAIQSGLPNETRAARLEPVVARLDDTFVQLQADVATAVARAEDLGIDAQSRYATQSLGLARMQALLNTARSGLDAPGATQARMRAHIDTFSSAFDPLLSQAVQTEVLFRNEVLRGIETLRQRLTRVALAMAIVTLAFLGLFYVGLIRPQFQRLDRLHQAADQMARADFQIALPDSQNDEIGRLYSQTNRMAQALARRQAHVTSEWARLNDVIDERTQALSSANAALAEIDENRRRFFADVSHELRTPLTVILMEAQIGRKETDEPAFATIEARAARLNRRIDDLLRVARSDTGQLALDPHPTPLRAILSDVEDEVRAEVENAGMTLETTALAPDLTLHCDANWIRQVLASLIRNAITHARNGRFVALCATQSGNGVEIAIRDRGPGIHPEDQTRLFDRFSQAGSNAKGFGIGLALARWVIQAHGGQIALASPPPGETEHSGTQVTVHLPVAAPSEP